MSAPTPEQHEIVMTPGHLAVTAIAGSGKTTTALSKVEHIHRNDKQAKVVMVLFGKDPAAEIRERATKRDVDMDRFVCGTFHSLSLRHLMRAGFKKRIGKQSEFYAFATEAMKKANLKDNIEDVFNIISSIKYKKSINKSLDDIAEPYLKMYTHYERYMLGHNIVDFDDILLECTKQIIQRKIEPLDIDFLIVDEFQDVDQIQLSWVLAHVKFRNTKVMAVGDDDQSIFGFRNALGVVAFEQFLKATNASLLPLSKNFRSPQAVLDSADNLIKKNKHRIVKELIAHEQNGAGPKVIGVEDKAEELDHIVDFLRNIPKHDNAVVVARTNRILKELSEYLEVSNIPHQILGGTPFWESRIPSSYAALLDNVASRNHIAVDIMSSWSGSSEDNDSKLQETFNKWKTEKLNKRTEECIEEVYKWMAFNIDRAKASKSRENAVRILEIAKKSLLNARGTVKQRLQFCTSPQTKELQRLNLMTLHQSKGMEFDHVWICRCNRDVIPGELIDEETLEEERRLFYVGMTRTQSTLQMSYYDEATPFIDELINEEELEECDEYGDL